MGFSPQLIMKLVLFAMFATAVFGDGAGEKTTKCKQGAWGGTTDGYDGDEPSATDCEDETYICIEGDITTTDDNFSVGACIPGPEDATKVAEICDAFTAAAEAAQDDGATISMVFCPAPTASTVAAMLSSILAALYLMM